MKLFEAELKVMEVLWSQGALEAVYSDAIASEYTWIFTIIQK